jgi:glyoxylase I family protein
VTRPFRTLGLDHVVLRVRDLERALAFYTGALDGVVERRSDALGLTQVRIGRCLIDLVPVTGPLGKLGGAPPDEEGRNLDHFAIQIEPFDEAALRAYLSSHGVEPGDVALRYGAQGNGPSMYVRDPDGNVVELKGPPTESV